MENNREVSQKIKNRTIIWSSNFTCRYLSEGNKMLTQKGICISKFIAPLFIAAKKQPKCQLIDEWIKKIWYIFYIIFLHFFNHNKEGNPAILTTWINLEDIMPSELSQIQKKTNTVWFHPYEVPRVVRFMETENRMVVARS